MCCSCFLHHGHVVCVDIGSTHGKQLSHSLWLSLCQYSKHGKHVWGEHVAVDHAFFFPVIVGVHILPLSRGLRQTHCACFLILSMVNRCALLVMSIFAFNLKKKQYYNVEILFWCVKLCEMLRTLLWICTLWISCDWLIVFVSPPGCVQLVVTALQHKTASEDIHRWTDTPWLCLWSVCWGQLVWKRGTSLLLASSPEVCSFWIGWGNCMYVLMCYAQENKSTYTNPVSSVCAPEF